MRKYEVQCGKHHGIVLARDPYSAWRKVVGKADDGFAKLARYREMLPATLTRTHRAGWSPWFYVSPRTIDMREPIKSEEAHDA